MKKEPESEEECADDDEGESKMADDKESVKRVQEKVTKSGKQQQKPTKPKADDSKDELKSDKKPEQSKPNKVSNSVKFVLKVVYSWFTETSRLRVSE